MTRNMAYSLAEVGGRQVFVAVHTKQAPSDEEWAGWTSMLERHAKASDWNLGSVANLVITDGGAPSTAQRTAVNVLISQAKSYPAVALVTDSALVRTLIRAFSIFNPRIHVFAPADIGKAAEHLGFSRADVPQLIGACTKLESDTMKPGAVETLGVLTRVRAG